MEKTSSNLEPLIERIEVYAKTSFELYRLRAIRKSAEIASVFVSHTLVVIVFSMFLIFASTGLSFYLGDLFGKVYLGFLCVAAFYVLLGIILIAFLNEHIKIKVSNAIISEVLKD